MNVKKIGAIVATVVLVLGLSGCVRIISNVTLHENNTASGETVVAVQEGIGASMGMTDQEFADSLNMDTGTDTMVNAKVTPYNQDGYVGTRVTFTDEPLDSFKGVDGTITRESDTFVFQGTAPDSTQTQGLSADSGAIATMSITFPGKVTDHNGTLEGNTVTWDLLTQTEAPHATGSAIGGGGSLGLIVLIIGGLIIGGLIIAALLVVGIVLLRRRSDVPPTDEAPPAAEPAA